MLENMNEVGMALALASRAQEKLFHNEQANQKWARASEKAQGEISLAENSIKHNALGDACQHLKYALQALNFQS